MTLREFIKTGDTLLEVRNSKIRCQENLLVPARRIPVSTAETQKLDTDGLGVLVAEVVPEHSCLLFCATNNNCESVSQLVTRQLSKVVLQTKAAEKQTLRKSLEVFPPFIAQSHVIINLFY